MKQHNLSSVWHTLLCIVLLVLAFVLQSSLGVRIAFFGVHIDLLPLIVAAAGVVLGAGPGFVCGFAAGLLYDVSGSSSIEGLYPLYYLLCGILCGVAGEQWKDHPVRTGMLGAVCSILALAVLRYLFDFQFSDMGILNFIRDIIGQLLLAVILSPIVVWIVRKLSGRKKAADAYGTLMEGGADGSA
ncbi:MAG: rod shape-determining protein MreD [Eubacteriales bacterium]|nr:rod shape-determining protein MreD [Eubacteriales bacterium]